MAYYGRLHGIPVVAVPPEYSSQGGSGVLSNGTPCRQRIRKSLSVRTHICPRGGLILDRDHHAAAVNILARGLALARAEGRWPGRSGETRETSAVSETSAVRGTVGHTET